MAEKDLYSYFLTVDGTDEERAAVHVLLNNYGVLGDKLVATNETPVFSHYEVDERWGAVSEWDEEELNDTLHQIALAVPSATLELQGNNETDRISRFVKRFHGDLYQMAGTVTEMQSLREDGDRPYAQRNDPPVYAENRISTVASLAYDLYKQDWLKTHTNDQSRLSSMAEYLDYVKECTEEGIPCGPYDEYLSDQGFRGTLYVCMDEFLGAEYLDQAYMVGLFKGNEALTQAYREDLAGQGIEVDTTLHYEEKKEPVFILCEEFESDDVPRSFTVHAVSENKESLQKLLAAKVQKDEYGFIAKNGVDTDTANHFCSSFENDCFVEYYILDETVLSREKTLDLLQTKPFDPTFTYPDNFRNCVLAAVAGYTENHGFGQVDCDKVADDLMQNQSFQVELKTGCSWWFTPDHLSEVNIDRTKNFTTSFLEDILDERLEYFSEIGAAPSFNPPENLKDILIDCIYDVSKANHMPVNEPELLADKILRNSDVRSYISKHCEGISTLEPGTMEQLRITTFCMNQVKGALAPAARKPALSNLIRNALGRTGEADKSAPEKEPTR